MVRAWRRCGISRELFTHREQLLSMKVKPWKMPKFVLLLRCMTRAFSEEKVCYIRGNYLKEKHIV